MWLENDLTFDLAECRQPRDCTSVLPDDAVSLLYTLECARPTWANLAASAVICHFQSISNALRLSVTMQAATHAMQNLPNLAKHGLLMVTAAMQCHAMCTA